MIFSAVCSFNHEIKCTSLTICSGVPPEHTAYHVAENNADYDHVSDMQSYQMNLANFEKW